MRFVMAHHADEDEAFAPDAFAQWVGRRIPLHLGHLYGTGMLLAAQVRPDGRSVFLTVEVEDNSLMAGMIQYGYQPGTFGRGGEIRPAEADSAHGPSDSW